MNSLTPRELLGKELATPANTPEPSVSMRDFVRAAPVETRSKGQRAMGGLVAIGVQVTFIAALIAGTMHEMAPKLDNITVVNVVQEVQVHNEPPPPPPPRLDVPVVEMQVPLVTITEPQPAPRAITAVVTKAPPAPLPPPPRVDHGYGDDPVMGFQKALLRHLNRHKRYPAGARAKREQGVVYVRFAMDRHGRVLRAGIERRSKYIPLDEEGLALLQRAQPLPEPPTEIEGDPLEMVVPVEFSLR